MLEGGICIKLNYNELNKIKGQKKSEVRVEEFLRLHNDEKNIHEQLGEAIIAGFELGHRAAKV